MAMRKLIPTVTVVSVMMFVSVWGAATDPMHSIETKLNSLITAISDLDRKLNQHESSLNSHQSTLNGITTWVNSLTTKLDSLGKTISDASTKISHQDSKLHSQKHSMDILSRQMSTQNGKLTRDEGRMHNMTRKISQHQSSIGVIASSVGTLTTSTSTLNSQSLQNMNQVNTEKHDLERLTNQVTTHGTKIKNDEARLNNISSTAHIHDRTIASIDHTLSSQTTKLNQQDGEISDGEKILGTLVNDMNTYKTRTQSLTATLTNVEKLAGENTDKAKSEMQTMDSIGNQLMQQQTFVEERIRSDGMSGIKSLRHNQEGTQPYFGTTHIGGSALSAHDHADYDRTIGLGEFDAVMNGVDFRTRHNDYKFKKPKRDHTYNAVEDIPFPPVPSQVTNKKTLQEKIVEMRAWFKAFKDQDHSVRDYRKYFKPNLCYLEGGWTLNAKTLSEPFDSDRHHIDARSWFDLQEKIRFTSYSGSKSNLENFAYLPTMMYNLTDGIPQIAQWNYRILCHPLRQDVPTAYFQLQDDLSTRLAKKYTWDRLVNTRSARFKLNEFGTERYTKQTILDSLMHEVPGKNNYGNNLTDNAFGNLHYDISAPAGTDKVLNVGYYHRWYKLMEKGAMGLQVNHRGFRDENLWVAMTTQPNIMPMTIKHCSGGKCDYQTRRVTYALPLEIVYSTPLQNWNPLNLDLHEESAVSKGGRNGGQAQDKAYNGTSFRHYYRTPVEFYHDRALEKDSADTARAAVGVLDRNEQMKKAAPTGFRIMTPNIQDVGSVRTRYPIFPVHSEGTTLGAEIGALKSMVMQMSRTTPYFESPPLGSGVSQAVDADVDFEVRESAKNPPGLHGHDFTLTSAEYKSLVNGTDITVTTSYNLGHNHELIVHYNTHNHNFYITKCDGQANCWDNHSHWLRKV